MKTSLILAFLGINLLFIGCEVSAPAVPDEEAAVVLAEETSTMPLTASFMSQHETFSYTLSYDGNVLKLLDLALDGGMAYGPNFKIEKGGEITGQSDWANKLDYAKALTQSKLLGKNEVKMFTTPSGKCSLKTGIVMMGEEALALRLKTCPGEDAAVSLAAFDSLFKGLQIQAL